MNRSKKLTLSIAAFLILIGLYGVVVFAAPEGGYSPSDHILEPDCEPEEDNCFITVPWEVNGEDNFVYNLADRIGLHTDSPLATLHILATQTLIPGDPEIPGEVGPTSYTGSGLDDATFGGQYNGVTENCQILAGIYDLAPGNGFDYDRFQYGYGGGVGCNGGGGPVLITPGVEQEVVDGITITFESGTGHTLLEMSPLNELWSADVTPGTPGTPDTYEAGDDPFLITDESDNELFNISANGEVSIKDIVDGPSTAFSITNFVDDTIFSISGNGSGSILGSLDINGVSYIWPSSQAAAADYVLTNDGTGQLSWAEAGSSSLPDQTGNSGKYLTTDGSDASWADISVEGFTYQGDNNMFAGTGSGENFSSGVENMFIGINSGVGAITGSYNTALGMYAMRYNTLGSENTAFGSSALSANTEGHYNTAVGAFSLNDNTTGTRNTAVGRYSLLQNTDGNWNTAVGVSSLVSNTSGSGNTAVGDSSLLSNTTGGNNSAFGIKTLFSNTTGNYNTASGYEALNLNTTGDLNSAFGFWSLLNNTTGTRNTASGTHALQLNSTGSYNTAFGSSSLFLIL